MINLAAAAVLVRDLTEQHLDGASGSAPGRRSRKAPQPAPLPGGRPAEPMLSRPGGARRRIPRSA
jgi:hypothetical protein